MFLQSLRYDDTTTASVSISSIRDEVFMTTAKIGNQDFTLVIDVGSADTWIPISGFKCVQRTGFLAGALDMTFGKKECKFSRTYEKSSIFSQIPNQHFSAAYTDDEYARP